MNMIIHNILVAIDDHLYLELKIFLILKLKF